MRKLLCCTALALLACTETLYPSRPPVVPGPPIADPPFTRLNLHLSITRAALLEVLERSAPAAGGGQFSLLGTRQYRWKRTPFALQLQSAEGRIAVSTEVLVEVDLPGGTIGASFAARIDAEPVIGPDYKLAFQSAKIAVVPKDKLVAFADWSAGIVTALAAGLERGLHGVAIDLGPLLGGTATRMSTPIAFAVGDAQGCADLGVKSVEMGPTLLQGGIEKDVAITLAPSVTFPCAQTALAQGGSSPPNTALPLLQNVAMVPSGPFEITVPIAASYDELRRAMAQAFTNGRLYFSKDQPGLYLERPELWASGGELVVLVHIDGQVTKGITTRITGDLYLFGHPEVRDNELLFPDMQPTVETTNVLLRLKTKLDAAAIRDQVRQALRVDISQRLSAVKQRLSKELTYRFSAAPANGNAKAIEGCVLIDLGRVELASLFAHDSYLRLFVKATGQATVQIPCPLALGQ